MLYPYRKTRFKINWLQIQCMNLIFPAISFVVGLAAGIGLTLLYIQYQMYSQVGKMEEQMEEMMNLEEKLGEEMEE